MSKELIENIGRVHTTDMGIDRIKKNLALEDVDVVAKCRSMILEKGAVNPAEVDEKRSLVLNEQMQ